MTARKNRVLAALLLGTAVLAMAGCDNQDEGPAERAGKEIDKAVTEAGEQFQAAESKVREAFK